MKSFERALQAERNAKNEVSLQTILQTKSQYNWEDVIQMGELDEWLTSGTKQKVQLLQSPPEEADDRIMLNFSHAVKMNGLRRAITSSVGTDVFVNLLYSYLDWKNYGLREIWFEHLSKYLRTYSSE